ncbi:MAG: alpha/beta hydrolase [Gammaproteobacteria bacterium]|nr:alpha/beta hydrolase [Gammaproteobacteria bacterium]
MQRHPSSEPPILKNDEHSPQANEEAVVLVHGIWMQGFLMKLMAKRLKAQGFDTHVVSYRFLKQTPAENATILKAKCDELTHRTVHWVGHSLGGIVILHLLEQNTDLPPGKVVLLGSPVRGSAFASKLYRNRLFRPLLGRSVENGLLGGAPEYTFDRPLGIITGSLRLGLGSVLFAVEGSDGVVSVEETRLQGITDEISVRYTHSMMVFSKQCARRVAEFLTHGHFTR